MPLVIKKDQIDNFVKELKEKHTIVDARKSKNLVPLLKEVLYPAKEDIFKLTKKTGEIKSIDNSKELIIFGLVPADLRAIKQLDEIMQKPEPDFFYWQKRNKVIFIGLSNYSLDYNVDADIVFEKINSRQYKVLVTTDKGKKIKSKLFKKLKRPKIKEYSHKNVPLEEMVLDSELLSKVVKWSYKHPIWDELDKKCLGCGNCTYVCPLCYCFSTEDRVSLNGEECTRCRLWDSCTLPDFARVAGDHDFHKGVKNRYYNWFYHKFVRGYKEYGKSLCVACHRCQEACPAGIDIEKVLLKLISDYIKG
ncbi:MAG: 4Fe-4S dicluster domain-containing protein [bacterium]